MLFSTLLNSLAIVLSLSTATGVLVHDLKIDKAAMTVLAAPLLTTAVEASTKTMAVQPELHTHVERTTLSQALLNAQTNSPSLQPRANEDKKYSLPKNVVRGHHAFDNYSLPIV